MCYAITCEDLTTEAAHASYPHDPGTLYDCPACEGQCFCVEISAGQDVTPGDEEAGRCVGCEIAATAFATEAYRKYGPQSRRV